MSASNMPSLSTIIPVFKSRESLKLTLGALSSVKAVNEVVVVENGSADLAHKDLSQEFRNLNLRLIQLKKPDLSTARNVGLALSTGSYCWFLDADDLIDPRVIEEALARLAMFEPDVTYLGMRHEPVDFEPGQPKTHTAPKLPRLAPPASINIVNPGWFLSEMLIRNTYTPVTGAFIFRRKHLEAHNIKFHEGYFHEDHYFSGAAISAAESLLRSDRPGFIKVAYPKSLSRSLSSSQSAEGYKTALKDLIAFAGQGSLKRSRILPLTLLLGRLLAKLVKIRMCPQGTINAPHY